MLPTRRENASVTGLALFSTWSGAGKFFLSGIYFGQLLGGRNARRYRHCRDFRIFDIGVGFCRRCDCGGHPLQIAPQKSVRDRRLFGRNFTRACGVGVLLDLGVRLGPLRWLKMGELTPATQTFSTPRLLFDLENGGPNPDRRRHAYFSDFLLTEN